MWAVLAVVPFPRRQKEISPGFSTRSKTGEPSGERSGIEEAPKNMPSLCASDLKNDQIFIVVMTFERAATTARYHRCRTNMFKRLAGDVIA